MLSHDVVIAIIASSLSFGILIFFILGFVCGNTWRKCQKSVPPTNSMVCRQQNQLCLMVDGTLRSLMPATEIFNDYQEKELQMRSNVAYESIGILKH